MADKKYKSRIEQIRDIRNKSRAQRERNITTRVGKPLIWNETQIVDSLGRDAVPTQMQHCILKVRKKVPGSDMEKFISAFNICGWVFTTYGYQKPNSMTLTGKGMRNNTMHRKEVDAGSKRAEYRSLVDRLYGTAIEDSQRLKDEVAKEKFDKWKTGGKAKAKPKVEPIPKGTKSTKVEPTGKAQPGKPKTKASDRMKREY